MPNTLTNLIPDAYRALDVVSRELTGFIPSVLRDAAADRVALNQTLRSTVAPANTAGLDITPAMSLPSASDQVISNRPVTITKSRAFPFSWTGSEEYSVNQGPGYLTIRQDQIAQAIRSAVNEMELDIALAAYRGASRAFGTAGTTPFASNLTEIAQLRKILDDNGTPANARSLVLNTTAGAAARSLAQLNKVNESGDTNMLRQGTMLDIFGLMLKESAQIPTVTKGTGTGYLVNNAGPYPIGTTAITLDTGSGTILAGDVITFAGDTNKYVVATALAANAVTIAEPGLRQTLADNVALTVGNNFSPNVAFRQSAILLATRLPDLPSGGDIATMRETVTDPNTGLSFELAQYPGFRMNVFHVSASWGVSVIKPEHIAILLG